MLLFLHCTKLQTMVKHYYDGIEWYDYLVFLVYNGIFTYLLYRLGDVYYTLKKKTVTIFLLLFQCYFFIVVADSFFNFLPYLHDSELYSYMISSGQYPQTSSENIIVLYYLSLFIGLVCLNSPVIYTFFCIFLFINAMMFFLKAWKKYYPFKNEYGEYIFAVLCLLWPAGVLYNTAPLREAFVLFGFAVFIDGMLGFIHEKKWKLLVFGSILLCAFRIQLFVLVIPVIGVLLVSRMRISTLLKGAILGMCVSLVFLFIRYVIIEGPLTPEVMAQYRNISVERSGSLSYGSVHWQTYPEMFVDDIFLILQFIFSPLPVFVQHNPFSTLIPFLDVIFISFLLLVILLKLKNIFKAHKPLLAFLIFYIILFGTYEYHITGAVRHRMPLEVLFMLLVSSELCSFVSKKFTHAANQHSAINHK